MSSDVRVSGIIMIEPPLKWGEVAESDKKFIGEIAAGWASGNDIRLVMETDEKETDEGTLTRRLIVAIEARWQGAMNNYHLAENLREVLKAHPDREFKGHLECRDADKGDLWRLRIKDGVVEDVKPKIVWPD